MNREIHYLYGGNGLAGIYVRTDGKDTLFAAVTDRQNSLTAVMDVATGKIEKFSYKPWGMRRNPANWSENVVTDYPARFSRGYCMHEHLPQFGLINMGGRIFDERTNQFLSADPYRQAPESWLNCNRFGYCMGNPVMYTDPDGELWWLIPAIAAIVGGTANLVSNWDNIDGFWQGFASFGVGAAAGFGTACAFTFGGPAAGMFAATGTGAITAATNNIIGQTGRNFEGFSNIDVQSVWKSAGRGALIAGISSMAGCYGSQLGSSLFSGISSPILQSGLVGMTAGLASGLAGGSMAAGLYQDPNLIWQSSLLGAGLGFAIPATYSGIQSARMGINPWTGNRVTCPDSDLMPMNALVEPQNLGNSRAQTDDAGTFTVTPDGVVLPKNCEIPQFLEENPYYQGSYGKMVNGKYKEVIRIDQGTPSGRKDPEVSHFHLNGGKVHIFDINLWPYKK